MALDYEDVTVSARRGGSSYLLVPTEFFEQGKNAPVFNAVVYDDSEDILFTDSILSFDAIAKVGYWVDDGDLPDLSDLLSDSHLKRLDESNFGVGIGPNPLAEGTEGPSDMVSQPSSDLDWLHYDYEWDEESGRFLDEDGEPVDFGQSNRNFLKMD